jgi:hypothetical protein
MIRVTETRLRRKDHKISQKEKIKEKVKEKHFKKAQPNTSQLQHKWRDTNQMEPIRE